MNILVACEESQRVCQAFRDKGHNAFSCDIIATSGEHPEWHIQQDVLPLLNGNCTFTTCDGAVHSISGKWDMLIAFPPCTHLSASGAAWYAKKREDGRQQEAIEFFCKFLQADCEKIVVENPVGIISGNYIKQYFPELCKKYGLPKKADQVVHPWMFGENVSKGTCLWLKGVKPLIPAITEKPELQYFEWYDEKAGRSKRCDMWHYEAYSGKPEDRAKNRSKTFKCIADAMAEQWG